MRSLRGAEAWRWTGPGKKLAVRVLAMAAVPMLLVVAGCGGGNVSGGSTSNGTFTITPGSSAITIDTNCTGCNGTNSSGTAVEQFTAALNSGGAAAVTWTATGGDANSGPGSINQSGQYTPPSYLTANSVQVTVTAALTSTPSTKSTAIVTVTPGSCSRLRLRMRH